MVQSCLAAQGRPTQYLTGVFNVVAGGCKSFIFISRQGHEAQTTFSKLIIFISTGFVCCTFLFKCQGDSGYRYVPLLVSIISYRNVFQSLVYVASFLFSIQLPVDSLVLPVLDGAKPNFNCSPDLT